jgi:hypothetical protein
VAHGAAALLTTAVLDCLGFASRQAALMPVIVDRPPPD